MTYKEAEKRALAIHKDLKATDPRLRRWVHMIHEDGSVFTCENAFALKIDRYVAVFTEHHNYFLYDESEVQVRQFNRIYERISEEPEDA